MSNTHSSTVAEERLYPSVQDHQATLTTTTDPDPKYPGSSDAKTLGSGPGKVEPIAAFEVTKARRILQVSSAFAYVLLAGGIVFGYAALKPVLLAEGVYHEYCTPEEIEKGYKSCYQQELRLNFMFTIAAVATNFTALFTGTILDQYGPRVTSVIGAVLLALGSLLFALAKEVKVIDPYPIAYLLLALAGPFLLLAAYHLANAFPRRSGLVMSILTGAFDSSSAVFLVYRLLYQGTNGAVGFREWFLPYLIIPAAILFFQLTFMPTRSYKNVSELTSQVKVEEELLVEDGVLEQDPTVDTEAVRSRKRQRESTVNDIEDLIGGKDTAVKREKKREESGVWGAMHGKSVKAQIMSWWFWGIAFFTVVQMTRINYFVATVRPQYEFLMHSYSDSVKINHFFDIALPVGGLIAVPFIGLVLDYFSTLTVLSILVSLATLIGVLGLIPDSFAAAYINVICFVIYRPFYYTVVSDYSVKVFGIEHFGKLYGAIISLAGFFNLIQPALDTMTYRVFARDPRPVNMILTAAAAVVGLGVVLLVWRRGKKIGRGRLETEAREASETALLMPGGRENREYASV